ncbi:MAG: phosphatidylserine decarboxylase [Caulobacterales bacterium]
MAIGTQNQAEADRAKAPGEKSALRAFFRHMPKIDPDGRIVILGAAVASIILWAIWSPLLVIGVAGVVMAYVGFRDPDRRTFDMPDTAMSPVDGLVVEIDGMDPPSELHLPAGDYNRLRISSSPFSVSTWRAPVTGQISALNPIKGKLWNVAVEPDDPDNNKYYFAVTNAKLPCGAIFLSGGLVPRFITDVEHDTSVVAGGRIGQRLYGGWVDVYVPVGAAIQVSEGQTLVAGETQIAKLGAATPPVAHLR